MPNDRPNILIFMTDQQQGDVVHPDHPCRTPNATRVADQGIIFTHNYTPTAHCCPSRSTFMTGLYPSRHGVYNNVSNPVAINKGLNEGVRCFSEDLRESGYDLTYAGKWHVSDFEDPADRGWDELLVTARKGSYMHRSHDQFRKLAREPQPDRPRGRGEVFRPGWGHYKLYGGRPANGPKGYEDHRDYKVVKSAIDALPGLAQQGNPWMLYVGPVGPHDPFIVPQRFVDMYDPKEIDLPPSFYDTLEDKPRTYQRMRYQYWAQLSEDEVRESIACYWAYCTMLDAMFGEVLDALDATGQADNTLVLFMSDHGDYCGAHGLYAKGAPAFREAYNVPCIARWPRGIRNPGREVNEFLTLADFAPTFLELAGCSPPTEFTGRSITPFFDGAPSDWRDTLYAQFNGVELYYSQRTAATKKWKYVYNGFDFDELYDLENDPYETVNLAAPARMPQPLRHVGEQRSTGQFEPWPRLAPELEPVRRDMLERIWRFNAEQEDMLCNPYCTVAFAPFGPMTGMKNSGMTG